MVNNTIKVTTVNYEGIIIGWDSVHFQRSENCTYTILQNIKAIFADILLKILSSFDKRTRKILRARIAVPSYEGRGPIHSLLIQMRKSYLKLVIRDHAELDETESYIQVVTWEEARDVQRVITSCTSPAMRSQTAQDLLSKSRRNQAQSERLHQAFLNFHQTLHEYCESPFQILFSSLDTQPFKRAVDEFRAVWI